MGTVFRLLNHRGLSTRRIAAAVDVTQGRLYDYMNGKSRVEKLSLFEQIADAFHIPGHLLGLARRSWEPAIAPGEGARTQACAEMPSSGDGKGDLAAVDLFRAADRQSGGGRLYDAVVRHLRDQVAPRLVSPGGSGRHAFAAAAALTEMAGWMAHDSGHDDLAGRHFGRALPLARVSGDTLLAANITASSSHLALQIGDAVTAAHWARVGLDIAVHGPPAPALNARLHTMHARALAASRQHTPAARSLVHAHTALNETSRAQHPWLSPFDEAALAGEEALAWSDLRRFDRALAHAEAAVSLRDEHRARSLALAHVTVATVHVRRGDLDAAVHAGLPLLHTSPALASVRVARELDALGQTLRPHRAYRPVREYLERSDAARSARMVLLADLLTPRST
ncbi:helix-turn-helix domain-containing protein [Streptomyces alboflavus]|nr:helix-turn-helix transcriptional regulator [Streptomyces alboflavus]